MRRVTHLGHGWIPFQGYGESLNEIGGKVGILKQAMCDAGRDPETNRANFARLGKVLTHRTSRRAGAVSPGRP